MVEQQGSRRLNAKVNAKICLPIWSCSPLLDNLQWGRAIETCVGKKERSLCVRGLVRCLAAHRGQGSTLLPALSLALEVTGEKASLSPHLPAFPCALHSTKCLCSGSCGGRELLNSAHQIHAKFSAGKGINLTLYLRSLGQSSVLFLWLPLLNVNGS